VVKQSSQLPAENIIFAASGIKTRQRIMIKEAEIVCQPGQQEDEAVLTGLVSAAVNIPQNRITGIKILKRSIDARGRKVLYRMQVRIFIDEPVQTEIYNPQYKNVKDAKRVIIVGAGPAGIFAALQCIEQGLKPVILERGKDVKQRRRDLANINKQGLVNPESNYCFGEGGAGTYSDGKLYTRSTKRGDVNGVLKTFVAHGATEDILVDARPHIGTNKLPQIITAMRESILEAGGECYLILK
jgi:uncharacterized FAD-dependent dehydrogenase